MYSLIEQAKNAKTATADLINLTEEQIQKAMLFIADQVVENRDYIIGENKKDVIKAKEKGLTDAFVDRLTVTEKLISDMAEGVRQVALLKSPRGKSVYSYKNELQEIEIEKVLVPFGVIGIIFESRPNVTLDAFALCFKSANVVMLKGGSDSFLSNKAIVGVVKQALKKLGINENVISLIEDNSHETAKEFMRLNGYIDLLIPRGGASLINTALSVATVPIIETGKGNCHIYIDGSADNEKAKKIIFNAKTQRYSVCNACESLVVNSLKLGDLDQILAPLREKEVKVYLDERAFNALKLYPFKYKATEEDFYTEYGDAKISVKTVDTLEEAILHINEHSTHHSESIVTEDDENADKFLSQIDSACVYHNVSTRFSDGFVFGLGAEIGISTQKLHARGPMGIDALFTTKFIVKGNGAIRK